VAVAVVIAVAVATSSASLPKTSTVVRWLRCGFLFLPSYLIPFLLMFL